MKLKKFRLIFILVVLIMGLSITAWSISIQHDHTIINEELQKELREDDQTGNTLSGKFSKTSPILFLFSAGLIGLVGVRRKRKNTEPFFAKYSVIKAPRHKRMGGS
jgi:hypothetical protein